MSQSIRSMHHQYAYSSGPYVAAHFARSRSRSASADAVLITITRTTSRVITTASIVPITAIHTFAVFVMAHSVQAVTP